MRRPLLLVVGFLMVLLAVEGLPAASQAAVAPASGTVPRVAAATPAQAALVGARRRKRVLKPQGFARRTVRAIAGVDRITVVWPARLYATGYTVTWAPVGEKVPSTPAACTYPCKRKYTRYTSMTLTSPELSSYGRTVSSRSGNTVRFKVFAHRGTQMRWTGTSYPYDAWISPSPAATVDWLPTMNSQMPAPYSPASGTNVAITSFNVLTGSDWLNRVGRIVSQVNNTGASILATQENSNTPVSARTAQYQDLANRLAPSGWVLADERDWDALSGAAHSSSTQATRIYFKSAAWTQVDRGALMTHVPTSGQTSGVNVDRWVSWTKLRSTSDASTNLCVMDLHLITNVTTNYTPWATHRDAEIAQVLSELRNPSSTVRRVGTRVGAACAGTPIVVAGDFNAAQAHAPWGNKPVGTMLSNGFVDTKNAGRRYNTRWSGPGPITAWHPTWGTQIDYLLSYGLGGAVSFKVNALPPAYTGSDHYPVTAVVSVPPS